MSDEIENFPPFDEIWFREKAWEGMATFSIYDRKSITLSRHVQWWNIEEIITLSRMKYKWTNFMWNQNSFLLPGRSTIKRVFQEYKKCMSWFSIRSSKLFFIFSCRFDTATRCPMRNEKNYGYSRRKGNEKLWDVAQWSRFNRIISVKE